MYQVALPSRTRPEQNIFLSHLPLIAPADHYAEGGWVTSYIAN